VRAARDEAASAWWRDRVVWIGALFGTAATAWVLFAGRYLPYIDWSNHLGLMAVLAHGDAMGSLQYLERSLVPSPYLTLYALTAVLGQLMPVDVAAKAVLSLTGGLMVLGAADLADATGRSPRLGVIAPLAIFGISMGYGFASFVLATPFLFFVLASAERLFLAGDPLERRQRARVLAAFLAVAYLSHAIVAASAVVLIGVRALGLSLHAAWALRDRPWWERGHKALTPIGWLVVSGLPALLVASPALVSYLVHPWGEAGTGSSPIFSWSPFAERAREFGGHLLERGSTAHWQVMGWTAALFGLEVGWSLFRTQPGRPRGYGLELYAELLVAMYAVGPMSVTSIFWFAYPRYAVMAGLMILLLPRVELSRPIALPLVGAALALVGWNAALNAQHVRNFSAWARPYDRVRELVPKGARVLPLTVVPGNDLANYHPALGSLYFYHLVDGAAYVPFLFDNPGHPVWHKKKPKPRAPFWRNPDSYDPRTHGKDYDYLVLRGPALIQRTLAAGEHDLVENVEGWAVFKTRQPTPRGEEQGP
jgi:hypothetical protein